MVLSINKVPFLVIPYIFDLPNETSTIDVLKDTIGAIFI
jgi:hypothetical protein